MKFPEISLVGMASQIVTVPAVTQLLILTLGIVILSFGLLIHRHARAVRRTDSSMSSITNTLIVAFSGSIAGGIASFIQQEIGDVTGSLLGVLLGGAIGGCLSSVIGIGFDWLTAQTSRRLSMFGVTCLVLGLLIEFAQIVMLRFAPTFP